MPRLTDRQPTPPPGSPFLPPAPGPQLPPAAREVQQRATAGLILVLLTLIAMLWGSDLQRTVYVLAVTLVISLVGLALVISAMRSAKRGGTRRPRGAMAGAVLGVLAALFSAFALVGFLAFWSQIMQYGNCMNGASTVQTQSACQTQLQHAITARIKDFGG
jgi:hypothetical protein